MKYPANFTQNIDPDFLATLPRFATYEGDAPDLKHLVGLVIETKDVEKLVYVGERENVWVIPDDGADRWQPWKGVYITELDPHGNPVKPPVPHEPLPQLSPRAMSRAQLGSLGWSDDDLANLAKTELGETYEPDRPGPSDVRRSFFDRVMAKVFG